MILKNLESNVNAILRENEIDFHIINSNKELDINSLIASDAIIFRSDRISHLKIEIEKIRKANNPSLYLKPIFVSTRRVKLKLDIKIDGLEGMAAIHADVCKGHISPNEGLIVEL